MSARTYNRPGVDVGWAFLFAFGHERSRVTQAGRSADSQL